MASVFFMLFAIPAVFYNCAGAGQAEPDSGMSAEPCWPVWQYDSARSGNSPHEVPEGLRLHWVRELPSPRRAWRKRWDDGDKLEFDFSYSPVVMGDRLFVPSSANDRLTAYEVETGNELWSYYADWPVRLAPAAYNGRVYFVSDDGYLHCVDAYSGKLVWKFDAAPSGRRVRGPKMGGGYRVQIQDGFYYNHGLRYSVLDNSDAVGG